MENWNHFSSIMLQPSLLNKWHWFNFEMGNGQSAQVDTEMIEESMEIIPIPVSQH